MDELIHKIYIIYVTAFWKKEKKHCLTACVSILENFHGNKMMMTTAQCCSPWGHCVLSLSWSQCSCLTNYYNVSKTLCYVIIYGYKLSQLCHLPLECCANRLSLVHLPWVVEQEPPHSLSHTNIKVKSEFLAAMERCLWPQSRNAENCHIKESEDGGMRMDPHRRQPWHLPFIYCHTQVHF